MMTRLVDEPSTPYLATGSLCLCAREIKSGRSCVSRNKKKGTNVSVSYLALVSFFKTQETD
ncbi:hypothetical protein P4815_15360, partial [Listeria monocytogenes]|nr:hypothetical protein [Listeria monocytogenes]